MSSAAAIVGATVCASGKVKLNGVNLKLPQADSVMIDIARRFGVRIKRNEGGLLVDARQLTSNGSNPQKMMMEFDLGSAPDVVPAVLGMVSGLNRAVRISNVGHLRFKESDRLGTLARGFKLLGTGVIEGNDSIEVTAGTLKGRRKPIVLDPQNDHRMLMAFTIAGLSGRFGPFSILNPECVKKSYPDFISDLQRLCGREGKKILRVAR